MRIKKKIILVVFGFTVLSSCQKDEFAHQENVIDASTTRSTQTSVIDQFLGMSVNITLPEGVAISERAYISAKKKHYSININSEDNGSGRERWIIDKYLNGYSLRALSSHNNNPYVYYYSEHPYMHNGPEKSVLQITPTLNNKFQITTQNNGTKYLQAGNYNSRDVLFNGTFPGTKGEWEITPIEDFELIGISYIIEPEDITYSLPPYTDEIELRNGGDVTQSMNAQFTRTATETSTFSRTNQVSLNVSETTKTGTPTVAEGQLSITNMTSSNWMFGGSEQQSDTRTYNFKLDVPAKSVYRAKVLVAMYNASASYIATYRSASGRTITLNGKWNGLRAGKISYEIYNQGVLTRTIQ